MCLRYAFATTDMRLLSERFGLEGESTLKPRYNISPTQNVPVVFNDSEHSLSEARWGLSASWNPHPLFNARAESIDSKPAFRKDFESRRCLMLADSFYEWKHPGKRPFRLFLKDSAPFAFAAIYAVEEGVRTCCMITTSSNELVSQIHNRMPGILEKGREREYMEATGKEAKEMLRPYPAARMDMYEVSSKVNSSRTDSPDLIKPKSKKETLMGFME